MTFDLLIIFDIPESQCLRCLASNVNVAFAFKIRNHRTLRCKQRNVAFVFKIRNHRALRCFLDLSHSYSLKRVIVTPAFRTSSYSSSNFLLASPIHLVDDLGDT